MVDEVPPTIQFQSFLHFNFFLVSLFKLWTSKKKKKKKQKYNGIFAMKITTENYGTAKQNKTYLNYVKRKQDK